MKDLITKHRDFNITPPPPSSQLPSYFISTLRRRPHFNGAVEFDQAFMEKAFEWELKDLLMKTIVLHLIKAPNSKGERAVAMYVNAKASSTLLYHHGSVGDLGPMFELFVELSSHLRVNLMEEGQVIFRQIQDLTEDTKPTVGHAHHHHQSRISIKSTVEGEIVENGIELMIGGNWWALAVIWCAIEELVMWGCSVWCKEMEQQQGTKVAGGCFFGGEDWLRWSEIGGIRAVEGEEILTWARKKTGEPIVRLNSVAEAEAFAKKYSMYVVGLFQNFEEAFANPNQEGSVVWFLQELAREQDAEGGMDGLCSADLSCDQAAMYESGSSGRSFLDQKDRKEAFIGWSAPPMDFFVLNIDGASNGTLGLVGAGAVIRDNRGIFIKGFAAPLGLCSAFEAELAVVEIGLEMAKVMGIQKLHLQLDNQACVEALRIQLPKEGSAVIC
uniref:RNase H type-1 domain-containing protein n=1 Tax=Chenopodium quinoa TaxID=63459 RepID=A0A803KUW8_CHEQI